MDKKLVVKYFFDSVTVLTVIIGLLGSFGAWESSNISFVQLIIQLVLCAGILRSITIFRNHMLESLIRHKPQLVVSTRNCQLKRTA